MCVCVWLLYHVLEAGGSSKQMALAVCDGTNRERKKNKRKDTKTFLTVTHKSGLIEGEIKVSYSINDLQCKCTLKMTFILMHF